MLWKFGTRGDNRMIKVHALSARDRFIKPTEQQIVAMAKSLDENGQLSPILVTPVTKNTYRVVAGATRYLAASRLHWSKIDCIIMHGSARECLILELTENADRKNLSVEQRKAVRAERRRLIAEHFKDAAPTTGGRGKKGGVRELAREVNLSRTTVQRQISEQKAASEKAKLAQNSELGPVSETTKQQKPKRQRTPIGIRFTDEEVDELKRYNATFCDNGPLVTCIRSLVRKALDLEAHKLKATHNDHPSRLQ